MTDHVALMREHAAQLRAQADRYEQAANLIEGEVVAPPKPRKPKREGRQERRPTPAGRKAGKTRQRVQDHLVKHPGAKAAEIARALGVTDSAIYLHLKALRK